MRGIMKAPAMLVTPRFDVEASRKIVAEAGKPLSEDRKRKLQAYAALAKNAFKK